MKKKKETNLYVDSGFLNTLTWRMSEYLTKLLAYFLTFFHDSSPPNIFDSMCTSVGYKTRDILSSFPQDFTKLGSDQMASIIVMLLKRSLTRCVHSLLFLLFLPYIYITKKFTNMFICHYLLCDSLQDFFPWGFWKKTENKFHRTRGYFTTINTFTPRLWEQTQSSCSHTSQCPNIGKCENIPYSVDKF